MHDRPIIPDALIVIGRLVEIRSRRLPDTQRAIVIAPDDVVAPVVVEIGQGHDMLAGGRGDGGKGIFGKSARGTCEPDADIPRIVMPNYVGSAICI